MKKILISLTLFLILSSCQTTRKATAFDGKWSFEGDKACLAKEDILKLREELIRCETRK